MQIKDGTCVLRVPSFVCEVFVLAKGLFAQQAAYCVGVCYRVFDWHAFD